MKKIKLLAITILNTAFLAFSMNSFSDTLQYSIMESGTINVHWISSNKGNLGIMILRKTADSVECASARGFECQLFLLEAMLYSDWNILYKKTVSWEIQKLVQKAGGKKLFNLTAATSTQIKEKENAIKSITDNSTYGTVIFKLK